jgi:hypothetical protein
VEAVCRRPACPVREISLTLHFAVHDLKPTEVRCPLCGTALHILSGVAVPGAHKDGDL